MKRTLVVALLCTWPATARAEDAAQPMPDGAEPDMLDPPAHELWEPKNFEAWMQIATRTDIFDGPHVGIGPMIDLARVWDNERRMRTGAYLALMVGSWGDGTRGHFSPELGLTHRASFFMDELFDTHVVLRVAANVGMF